MLHNTFFSLAVSWPTFLVGLFAGVGLILVIYLYTRSRQLPLRRQTERAALIRRLESAAILEALDLGILAYSVEGTLIMSNETAERFLGGRDKIQTITDFLELFPDQSGMTSALFLGTNEEEQNVTVRLGDNSYRIMLSTSFNDDGSRLASLIRLQDVTELERQDRQRKEFVANVSHELKTPLTTIKSYSESLLEWGLVEKDSDAVRRDVERIFDDVLRMEQLVADLLLLSTLDNKAQRSLMREVEAKSIVRNVMQNFQRQAEDKKIKLELVTLSRVPPLFCDRSSVERILNNLVANALRYTEEGGSVTLYVSSVVDEVNFKVSDTGMGVSPENLPHLFERFYRVDSTGSRRYGGTGLGLAIAKELTEIHLGKLLVSSVLGKGSEFTLVLPSAGKVFLNSFRRVRGNKDNREFNLYESAERELLLQARDFGFTAESLGDLSLEEEAQIMAQYNLIQTLPYEADQSSEEVQSISVEDELSDNDETDELEKTESVRTV